MDQAAQIASNIDLNPLKEPRGFIKLLEFILAIFAFATTTSVNTYSQFSVNCGDDTAPIQQRIEFGYAFRLDSYKFNVPFCNKTAPISQVGIYGNFSAPAEFYVFVGVMAFLYSLAAIILYVCFDEKYRKFDMIPIVDFIITGVFTLLWLISSSAWAQGVTDVKFYTNPDTVFELKHVPECQPGQDSNITCTTDSTGNFASLNVSIIFGFLNMCVWGSNLWFLFKETKWFKVQSAPPAVPSPSEQPQKV